MVVGPFRQQKVGHRCTRLRVILQPDLSLSTPQFIILSLQEDGAGSVDHRLFADAQSAIHIPAEKLCRAFFFFKLSAGLLPQFGSFLTCLHVVWLADVYQCTPLLLTLSSGINYNHFWTSRCMHSSLISVYYYYYCCCYCCLWQLIYPSIHQLVLL